MIVVSDSTPLISLMKAMKLDILRDLFGEVLIPEAVYDEVTSNDSHKDEAELIVNSDYIRKVNVNNPERVSFLQRATGLDLGESEAIIYADETNADLLLMDETAGRKVAQNMNLPMSGSTGILIQAFQANLLTEEEVEIAFDRIKRSNQHISDDLIKYALEIVHSHL